MPDCEPLLRVERLSVRYGGFVALDGLDLTLRPGEVFGLLGPNGAGKSTALRALTRQVRPAAGTVTVAGLDLARDWHKVKPLIGYVPDADNHFEEFSGRENLRFFAGLYGVGRGRVEECLDLAGLTEAGDLPVRAYSLGMRRKLLLARALLHAPRLLYLDEPTASLDPGAVVLVHGAVKALAARGGAVLLTTHNRAEAGNLCDTVGVLRAGRLTPAAP